MYWRLATFQPAAEPFKNSYHQFEKQLATTTRLCALPLRLQTCPPDQNLAKLYHKVAGLFVRKVVGVEDDPCTAAFQMVLIVTKIVTTPGAYYPKEVLVSFVMSAFSRLFSVQLYLYTFLLPASPIRRLFSFQLRFVFSIIRYNDVYILFDFPSKQ